MFACTHGVYLSRLTDHHVAVSGHECLRRFVTVYRSTVIGQGTRQHQGILCGQLVIVIATHSPGCIGDDTTMIHVPGIKHVGYCATLVSELTQTFFDVFVDVVVFH